MKSTYTPKALAVVFVAALAPLVLAFTAFVANEAQILFDMHLDSGALAAYISSFLLGVATIAIGVLLHLGSNVVRDLVNLLTHARAIPKSTPAPAPAEPARTPEAPAAGWDAPKHGGVAGELRGPRA